MREALRRKGIPAVVSSHLGFVYKGSNPAPTARNRSRDGRFQMELRFVRGSWRHICVLYICMAIQVQQVAALDTTTAMGIAAGCVLGVAALAVLLVLLWVKCRHKISASLEAKQESYKSFDGEGDFVLSPGCYTITNPGFELGPDTQGPIVLTTVPGVDADEVPPVSFTLSTFSNQEESVDQPQSALPSTVVDREAVSVSQQPLITSTSLGDDRAPDSPHSVSQSYVFCQETVPDSPQSVNLSPVSGQDSGLDLSQSFIILENPNAVVDDQNCT